MTGFLGCGKTTLLSELLRRSPDSRRIAVIQNEFSQTTFDGDILREVGRDFELRELNTGSIFCVCLFSQFKNTVAEIARQYSPDVIVVEASGIADPIAIAELVEDAEVSSVAYLSRIFTVVDAPRFEQVLSRIVGVKHQVQVADAVLVNKCDLVDEGALERVSDLIQQINPQAKELRGEFGKFDIEEIFDDELSSRECEECGSQTEECGECGSQTEKCGERGSQTKERGSLTKCGEGGFISKSFRYAGAVKRERLDEFLATLTDETLRLKGYVTTTDGERLMVQYVPNQTIVTPCIKELMGQCELISIGYTTPKFGILKTK